MHRRRLGEQAENRDAGDLAKHQQPRQQEKPTAACHQERLQGGAARRAPLMVEADQQEGVIEVSSQ